MARRNRRNERPDEPIGKFVERNAAGAECVYVVYRDGRKVLVSRGGHDVESLEHSFPTCQVCGEQHLSIGGSFVDCPRVGWTTGAWGVPFYPTGNRILQDQQDEASLYNRSVSRNLDIIAREVERRTGEKV